MPRAVSIQDNKQSGLKYEVLKTFSVTEKSRSGRRMKFKAFVGCGDDVTKIGLGVSIAKSRVEAINQAKTLVLKSLLNTPLSTGKTLDKRREGN